MEGMDYNEFPYSASLIVLVPSLVYFTYLTYLLTYLLYLLTLLTYLLRFALLLSAMRTKKQTNKQTNNDLSRHAMYLYITYHIISPTTSQPASQRPRRAL